MFLNQLTRQFSGSKSTLQKNKRTKAARKSRKNLLHNIESLEPRIVLDSTVVFNEIMYNPLAAEETLEFVELHNQMAVDLDISAWRLSGGVDYTFPEGIIVPGGGYVVIASDATALGAASGVAPVGEYVGQLSNGGEKLNLRDRNDRLMDTIDYSDGEKWSIAADGSGASLAKIDENTLSADASNWGSSFIIGGTPGIQNFPNANPLVPLFETVGAVSFGESWKYLDDGSDQGTAWVAPAFDDSLWSEAPAIFFAGTAQLDNAPLQQVTGVTVTASSELVGFDRLAAYLVDGSGLVGNTHSILPDVNMWLNQGTFGGGPADLAPEITFDLGSVMSVDEMKVWNYNEENAVAPGAFKLRGVGSADILISNDGTNFTTLIANQAFTIAPGADNVDFSQTIDLGGALARYVKLDILGNHGGDANFVGLSEVQFFAQSVPITELTQGPTTHYFRNDFEFSGNPDKATELVLNTLIDDGAVYYLNGIEIQRENMPAGVIDNSTLASGEVVNASQSGAVSLAIPAGSLVAGTNVLAVEVHQSQLADPDMMFDANLDVIVALPDPNAISVDLVELESTWNYLDNGSDQATAWVAPAFDDSLWSTGDGIFFAGSASPGDLGELITNVSATASSSFTPDGRLPIFAVNGDGLIGETHVFGPPGGNMWLSAAGDTTGDFTIDLQARYDIKSMRIWNYNEDANPICCLARGIQEVDIYVAGDDGIFGLTPVIAGALFGIAPGTQTDFSETLFISADDVRFIKIDIISNHGDAGFTGISEIQVTGDFVANVVLPAQPIPATIENVSSNLAGFDRLANYLVDGSGLLGSNHTNVPDGFMWLNQGTFGGGPADLAPEITFDLGSVQDLDHMTVWNYNEVNLPLRGVGNAEILISDDNLTFTQFIANQAFDAAPGLNGVDFSQEIDLTGATARYVKFDIINSLPGSDNGFVGLSEVQFWAAPTVPAPEPTGAAVNEDLTTELQLGPTTYYFRQEFEFAGDPALTELSLDTILDDGAIYYLNGVELYRQNMPAGAVTNTTLAASEVVDGTFSGSISVLSTALISGTNVLAVEVHQALAVADPDMVFDVKLTALVSPPAPPDAENLKSTIVFNEVTGGGASFQLELTNAQDEAINLDGYVIQSTSGAEHTLPFHLLAPGAFFSVDDVELGFTPASTEKLFLLTPTREFVSDGVDLKTTARARFPDVTGPWLSPDISTFGSANSVSFETDIVINEILYSYRPDFPTPGTPGTSTPPITLLDFSDTWRYNRTGNDLGAGWSTTAHPDDGSNWLSGAGLFGFEPDGTPQPILTIFPDPQDPLPPPFITTYYFETEFTFVSGGTPLNEVSLKLNTLIDDGAVFYLNGTELPQRLNMNGGAVTVATPAAAGIEVTSISLTFDGSLLIEGNNRLSVEVHQASNVSSDVVFGLELLVSEVITPAIPGGDFAENGEEWIELYNKGASPVDLTGWELSDAINYDFLPGTTIASGEYLVIAKDSLALQAKYPAIAGQIIGDYSGRLNNSHERIVLEDNVGNPADIVEYFENGAWPGAADGKGSSLELRDPNADNSVGLAWAASDEGSKSTWQTYTYEGVASGSSIGPDGQWQEFLLGLLQSGEVLLDDISVIQDPNGTPVELLQNGTFELDAINGEAGAWRIIGNHRHSEVIVDPDDPLNQVLRLVATGGTGHMHNHAETTLANGAIIQNGQTYRISYKAKWISGSPQVNTRLYFNRLARSTTISQPTEHGTPGAENSTFETNIGPTYQNFQHSSVVPEANEAVTVTVTATDDDGILQMNLFYSVDSGSFVSVVMTDQGDGNYSGTIPGQAASSIVQFYVEGRDNQGALTTFPREGADSRALYKVNDGLAATNGLHNLRIIVTPNDAAFLHSTVELMSNDRIGATVIYNESEIFYDVGVRLSGSERARPFTARLSFSLRFNTDHLFRGVHSGLTLDRSESTGFGQRELISHNATGHLGGVPTEYNDLVHIITPQLAHTGSAEMQMARYSDVFLDEQFDNGSDGRLYEYELTYFPTQTTDGNVESRKLPQPDGTRGVFITDIGDDKEDYRWPYLIKNNRNADDFSRLIEVTAAMGQANPSFNQNIGDFIDVDQWLRGFAYSSLVGHGDNYGGDGAQHNFQIYIRPSDNKALFLPHDLDAFPQVNRALVGNGDLVKLIADSGNEHMFLGHVDDMINTTYNQTYMQQFTDNYGELLPGQNFDSHLSFITQRSNFLDGQVLVRAAVVPYDMTTTGPIDVGLSSTATLTGTGWVNVREIRLGTVGSDTPLDVTWNTVTGWETTIPVNFGQASYSLNAYDFQGNLIGSESIDITSALSTRPIQDFLRITEINYNPDGSDAPEFIELKNISPTETLDLTGVQITDGPSTPFDFTGSNVTSLGPGEFVLVVKDLTQFSTPLSVYPDVSAAIIAGQFVGGLDNDGEMIEVRDADGALVQQFTFVDGDDVGEEDWHAETDGEGFTLVVKDATSNDDLNLGTSWRSSAEKLGSPGEDDPDALSADFNGDGTVNAADLAILLANYGLTIGADRSIGDANHDQKVSLQDLLLLKKQFGSTISAPPPAAAAAALVVTVGQEINILPQVTNNNSRLANRTVAHIAAVDRTLAEITNEANTPVISGEQKDALPIRQAGANRNTAAVDQVLATNHTQTSTRARSRTKLRTHRGHKIKPLAEKALMVTGSDLLRG